MKADAVTNLLEQVARGEVSVDDARTALEGVELDEATYESAIDHGVFNQVEPGTVVRASLSPGGTSALVILFFIWGFGWTLYWSGSLSYGLFAGWDQQQLSYHMGMIMVTLMLMSFVMRLLTASLVQPVPVTLASIFQMMIRSGRMPQASSYLVVLRH